MQFPPSHARHLVPPTHSIFARWSIRTELKPLSTFLRLLCRGLTGENGRARETGRGMKWKGWSLWFESSMLMERLPESFISNSYALHADKQRQFLCRLALDAYRPLIFFFLFNWDSSSATFLFLVFIRKKWDTNDIIRLWIFRHLRCLQLLFKSISPYYLYLHPYTNYVRVMRFPLEFFYYFCFLTNINSINNGTRWTLI